MNSRFIYNNKTLKERRRDLRNNQTVAEKLLWENISKDKIFGLRFLRQYGVGPYILDFYCAKIRLGIEVDGEIHIKKDRKLYDNDRDKYSNTLDIRVVRFWNNEILNNTQQAINKLKNEIKLLDKKYDSHFH